MGGELQIKTKVSGSGVGGDLRSNIIKGVTKEMKIIERKSSVVSNPTSS